MCQGGRQAFRGIFAFWERCIEDKSGGLQPLCSLGIPPKLDGNNMYLSVWKEPGCSLYLTDEVKVRIKK